MENAAEALKLAAWVLIFVAALSISMGAFSHARQSMDIILSYTDREYLTTYIPESGNTERRVGFETIIPAIYRAYKDNYVVVFPDYTGASCLYENINTGEKFNSIDLSLANIPDNEREEFLKRVLFGTNKLTSVADQKYTKDHFTDKGYSFRADGLYGKIKGKKFKESLGVYYEGEENGATLASEANKTKRRIITYEEV